MKADSVRAIGEVQSPPGDSESAKTEAFAQAGIYTGTIRSKATRSIASIVICKDMTVQLAMATVDPLKADSEDSWGEISYAPVDSMSGYSLRKTQLGRFAEVFVATLKLTCPGSD